MNTKSITKYIDVIFCLIVLPLMIVIFPVERWAQNFSLYTISVGIWLYLLFFINRLFVVPIFIRTNGKSLLGWLLVSISIGITIGFASVDLFYRDYTPFENSFKYGVSSIEESYIDISLYEEDGKMIFKTVNKVFNKNIDRTHEGLDNCKQRLKLSFPQRHSLEITNKNNTNSVILKLQFL